MSISRTTVYRKDILKLGYKNTHITPLISQAAAFKDIPKARGYAVQFDFKQAVLICVGCELFKLGLPFRHVDLALDNLSKLPITPEDFDLDIAGKTEAEIRAIFKEVGDRLEYLILRPGGQVYDMTELAAKVRMVPIHAEIYKCSESPLYHLSKSDAGVDSFVCVFLGNVVRRVTRLFMEGA